MAAIVSSNMTDSGSSTSLSRSPALLPAASDTWPAPAILITVADEAPRLAGRLVQTLHVQGSPVAREEQSEHSQQAPWNATGAGEQSPQPQPSGCACMRTEHAPQRQLASWDRPETPEEQDGHRHDLPQVRVHEMQEHPAPWAAARATTLLLLLTLLCPVRGEVDEAPPTKFPTGAKKASAFLATNASTAAPNTAMDFMGVI